MHLYRFVWTIRRAIAIGFVSLLAGIPVVAYQARSIQLTRMPLGSSDPVALDMKHVSSLQITVMATDEQGRPIRRATIIFILPAVGASAYFIGRAQTVTVLTGDDGMASARIESPNGVEGAYAITIRAALDGFQSAELKIPVRNFRPQGAPVTKIAALAAITGLTMLTAVLVWDGRKEPPPPNRSTIITLGPAVIR